MKLTMKPTKRDCCRYCVHYDLGYTQTTQEYPTMVCFMKPKRIYKADYAGVKGRKYHYRTSPLFCCGLFERKTEQQCQNDAPNAEN